jgi:hypothetical protein
MGKKKSQEDIIEKTGKVRQRQPRWALDGWLVSSRFVVTAA